MFSYAVKSSSKLASWNTIPKAFLTSYWSLVGEKPFTVTIPLVGDKSVVKILMVVVFPAPLGPKKATISPFFMEKEILSTAVNFPNLLVRFLTLMISIHEIPTRSAYKTYGRLAYFLAYWCNPMMLPSVSLKAEIGRA